MLVVGLEGRGLGRVELEKVGDVLLSDDILRRHSYGAVKGTTTQWGGPGTGERVCSFRDGKWAEGVVGRREEESVPTKSKVKGTHEEQTEVK